MIANGKVWRCWLDPKAVVQDPEARTGTIGADLAAGSEDKKPGAFVGSLFLQDSKCSIKLFDFRLRLCFLSENLAKLFDIGFRVGNEVFCVGRQIDGGCDFGKFTVFCG